MHAGRVGVGFKDRTEHLLPLGSAIFPIYVEQCLSFFSPKVDCSQAQLCRMLRTLWEGLKDFQTC